MADINKAMAADLWRKIKVEVKRFATKINLHPQSDFLGYADVVVSLEAVAPGFVMQFRGLGVKILKGNPHLEFPTEKGADDKYYPKFFPQSAELRAVLTTAIFKSTDVQSAIAQAAQLRAQAGTSTTGADSVGDENPFSA